MKRHLLIRLGVAALFAGCLSILTASRTHATQPPKGPPPQPKRVAPGIRNTPVLQPRWYGTVVRCEKSLDIKPETEAALALALRNAPVPASRVAAFAAFDQPNFRLDGWSALVRDVQADEGALTVKVEVAPLLSSTFGASTTVLGGITEQYRLDRNGLQLIGTAPPVASCSFMTD